MVRAAAGIGKSHEEHGKGPRETLSKQRLHKVSGKASAAAEFGRRARALAQHSLSFLAVESPFPLTVSIQTVFTRVSTDSNKSRGPGRESKFFMRAGSTVSGAD